MKKNLYSVLAAVGAIAATAVNSFAADLTVDYSSMTDAISAQVSPAITAALPIAGTLLAVTLGVKLVRRFAK